MDFKVTVWEAANRTSDIAGFQMPNVVLWLTGIAALVVACHTLWTKLVKPVLRLGKTVHATYEKVMEYDERIAEVESNTQQLTRNSGSHLADAVYRIEKEQQTSKNDLASHLVWSTAEAAAIRGEVSEVWKTLAARDTVKAALKTAEMIDAQQNNNDEDKG